MVNSSPYIPVCGDVVWITLNQQVGHEQAGRRAAVDSRSDPSEIEHRRVAGCDPRGYNAVMKNRLLGQWIEKKLADRPLRANSLIITIYGDMIAPHGGTVLLGGLIRLVAPLGLNPRTVRTSVFRLSREKWLVS